MATSQPWGMRLARLKAGARMAVLALCLGTITNTAVAPAGDGKGAGRPPAAQATAEKKLAGPAQGAKAAEEIAAINRKRVALAKKGYESAFARLRQTKRVGNALVQQGNPEEVHTWSVRLLQAERALSTKRAAHVAALEAHLKHMTDLEKAVKQLTRELFPPSAALGVEWYRLEAQLWLAEAKAK